MKKLLVAVATVGLLGFAGIQIASAQGGYGRGGGYGYCDQYSGDGNRDLSFNGKISFWDAHYI